MSYSIVALLPLQYRELRRAGRKTPTDREKKNIINWAILFSFYMMFIWCYAVCAVTRIDLFIYHTTANACDAYSEHVYWNRCSLHRAQTIKTTKLLRTTLISGNTWILRAKIKFIHFGYCRALIWTISNQIVIFVRMTKANKIPSKELWSELSSLSLDLGDAVAGWTKCTGTNRIFR